MDRVITISSEKVGLSPLEKDDLATYWKGHNDPKVVKYYGYRGDLPYFENAQSWYEWLTKNKEEVRVFAIIPDDMTTSVGTIGLSQIDFKNRRATVGLEIFKEFWGKGYGTEATFLIKRYSFELLNLRKLTCEILEPNKASIRVLEKNGFEEVGRFRKHSFAQGVGYVDEILYEIINENYQG